MKLKLRSHTSETVGQSTSRNQVLPTRALNVSVLSLRSRVWPSTERELTKQSETGLLWGVLVKRVNWSRDPEAIREFTAMAKADGFRLSSIVSGRMVLLRYSRFLSKQFKSDLYEAGWHEFLAYKAHLADASLSRATIRCYLSYIGSYYRLLAQATQLESISTLCGRIRTVGLPRRTWSERRRPFDPATLKRILRIARRRGGEDYIFLLTLLYTGGRAQFYGLKVREVNFHRMEISTVVKPGKRITIPLHPALAEGLQNHLSGRSYQSIYLFCRGHDPTTRKGMQSNRQNAWRICKRIEDRARLREPVYPHRFRKTLATIGRRAGMDPQFVQAILGHETVMATLDHYAQVDLEDVKREFAKLDLLGNGNPTNLSRRSRLLQELASLAPKDREREWNMHVEALLTIAHGSAELDEPRRSHQYFRVTRKRHATAKTSLRRAVQAAARE